MSLVLLVGGARSGKSRLAVDIVTSWRRPVVVIATAEPRDVEMIERIARHRAQRPATWTTIEEPLELERALGRVSSEAAVVIDCLTLWISNLMERGVPSDDIEARAHAAACAAAAHGGGAVAVTNEVGSGVVPVASLGRRYRDLMGRVNTRWANEAERSALVVAGRVLPLMGAEALFDD